MRRILATLLVSLLVVSAGCVGLITGETVEFESTNATVSDSGLDSTDYSLNNSSQRSVTREVSFLGQQRTIRVINQVNRYAKSGSLAAVTDNETIEGAVENETLQDAAADNETASEVPDLARFVVVSTPGAKVLGQTLNPAASWSNDRILEQVSEQTGKLDDLEQQGSRSVDSLGDSREVSAYTGSTTIKGKEVEVRAHVVSFEHEGDVIIAVAVHPEKMDEESNVDELLSSLEHSKN